MASKKKAAKKTRKKAPTKKRGERDWSEGRTETGQFVKGEWKGGPGRLPGIKVDFREAVRKRAEELGVDIRKELGTMAMLLLTKAKAGDVAAAKFVVERLCGLLVQEHEVTSHATVTNIPDKDREELRKITGTSKAQRAMLDNLEKRTNGTG